ncbi:MAG: hypothetical protein JRC99_13560, partial [Deltaproteobacteria bacterium]|nr:hypothetical protein [Deltaproteobacteria bacterium]
MTHLPQNEPNQDYIISHCLIINGFEKDPDIESFAEFQKKQQVYEPMMAANNLDFLVSRTNLRQFNGNELLKQSFAACITASELILGRLFS